MQNYKEELIKSYDIIAYTNREFIKWKVTA